MADICMMYDVTNAAELIAFLILTIITLILFVYVILHLKKVRTWGKQVKNVNPNRLRCIHWCLILCLSSINIIYFKLPSNIKLHEKNFFIF